MAKQTGGILGTPSGKIAGIIFSSARSRQGKVVTAREKVSPANPKTPGQVLQRNKFSSCVDLTKRWGPSIYQVDWNRSVGQLAGFNSVMSIWLGVIDDLLIYAVPPVTPLGDLHNPSGIIFTAGGASGQVKATWSIELGANGTDADKAIVIAQREDSSTGNLVVIDEGNVQRSLGAIGVELSGFGVGEGTVMTFYMRGAGAADGNLTQATYAQQDAKV